MVQEMNILRCYSCHIFQVHIVKKANKWQCKICNEKQSVQHVYYQGTGQECRFQVQHLNFLNHIKERAALKESQNIEVEERAHESIDVSKEPATTRSKWDKYLLPQKEYDELMGLDENEGLNLPYDYDQDTSAGSNTSQISPKTDKNSCDGKSVNEEDHASSASSNNDYKLVEKKKNIVIIRQHLKRKSDSQNIVPESEPNSFGSKSANLMLKRSKFEDDISNRKQSLRDIIGLHRSNAVNSTGKTMEESPAIARSKSVLKDINDIAPESQPNSFGSKSAASMLKRSKFEDDISSRKQSLRDIIGLRRSNAVNNTEKPMEESPAIAKSKSDLKEVNDVPNINVKETAIPESNVKKRTIFETDCDDLDEIFDF